MSTPLIPLLQAAYLAQDAIERMQDIASMEKANTLVGAYAKALLEAPPDLQAQLARVHVSPGERVPGLSDIQQAFYLAYVVLYSRLHNSQPAAA